MDIGSNQELFIHLVEKKLMVSITIYLSKDFSVAKYHAGLREEERKAGTGSICI